MGDNSFKYLKLLGKVQPALTAAFSEDENEPLSEIANYKARAIIHPGEFEITSHQAKDMCELTEIKLRQELENTFNPDTDHSELIDSTVSDAREAFAIIGDGGGDDLLSLNQAAALETVVIAIGTRPSIRLDMFEDADPNQWPEWSLPIQQYKTNIINVSKSIGRIDKNGQHYGTGFAVAPDLIMTNRHVVEQLYGQSSPSLWSPNDSLSIDFGTGPLSISPEIVFVGPNPINNQMDFNNLDVAILRCSIPENEFPDPLKFYRNSHEIIQGRPVYVIGFPAKPRRGTEEFKVLKKLFNYEFGHKRFSPGEIDQAYGRQDGAEFENIFYHDCTTLGGNSGSAILDLDDSGTHVHGLHFGGIRREANFAHSTARVRNDIEVTKNASGEYLDMAQLGFEFV